MQSLNDLLTNGSLTEQQLANLLSKKLNKIDKFWLEDDTVDWNHLDPKLRDCLQPLCNIDFEALINTVADLQNQINEQQVIIDTLSALNLDIRVVVAIDAIIAAASTFTLTQEANAALPMLMINGDHVYTEGYDFIIDLDVDSKRKIVKWDLTSAPDTTLALVNGDIIQLIYRLQT